MPWNIVLITSQLCLSSRRTYRNILAVKLLILPLGCAKLYPIESEFLDLSNLLTSYFIWEDACHENTLYSARLKSRWPQSYILNREISQGISQEI